MVGEEHDDHATIEDASPSGAVAPSPRRRQTLGRKVAFAAFTTAAFFLCLEGALRILLPSPGHAMEDPFVGFDGSSPVFTISHEDGEQIAKTSDAKRVWFNHQQFPVKKSPDTIRIVCLGGSTTFGRPFGDRTSFAGWLRGLLPRLAPDQRWEVINAGGVSYASYRVVRVMEELAAYDVDVFVVYTGQNEFLEWRTYGDPKEQDSSVGRLAHTFVRQTRLGGLIRSVVQNNSAGAAQADASDSRYRLPDEVDEMLNHSIGPKNYRRDHQWSDSVVKHFESNLERMCALSRDAGARLVFVSPISKLRDCAPFKSEFADHHDEATRAQLEGELERAVTLARAGEHGEALPVLDGILEQDNEHAGVHFLRGQTLFELGRVDEARGAYLKAVDHDICPLRATRPIKEAFRRVVESNRIAWVDMEAWLEQELQREYGHICPGRESFLDHVHPTIEMHGAIAIEVARVLVESPMKLPSPTPDQLSEVRSRILNRVDSEELGTAFRNLAKLWHWSGKFSEAVDVARDALRLLPNDLESRYVLADSLATLGETKQAIKEYDALFERGDYPRAAAGFGELLFENGDFVAAKAFLLEAILVEERESLGRVYFFLGKTHLALDEAKLALECFEFADKIIPNYEPIESALRQTQAMIDGTTNE